MKKFCFSFAFFSLLCACVYFGSIVTAQNERPEKTEKTEEIESISPNLVISQFQPGTSANPNDEFVEIKNNGSSPIDLNGYRVVYRSSSGVADVMNPFAVWTTSTILQPGQFYLIATTSYTGSAAPNSTYNPTSCACSMSATSGGLGIRLGANDTGTLIDSVGWGSATNIFIEGSTTTAPGSGNSKERLQNGCQDTGNNANDFATRVPFAPRNAATAPVTCSGGGTTLFAAINANPTTVSPAGTTLFTVTVIPATTPPSTNIGVEGNLAAIGGQISQPFFDNGSNGDVTAGDNIFSFRATIPPATAGGQYLITAVAHDAESRTVNLTQNITVNAPTPNDDPLTLGNPSNATSDVANENNYLLIKPQYTLSYSRAKATPNWTAWRLDSSWIGSTSRQDDFRPDTTLPAGWYQVTPEDYAEPVYDRGHMCPSGDRTNSVANNSATFLMTNMVPQHPDNNQGPWEDFESYCRTLASQGNEIYIVSGPVGNFGTIGATQQNRVMVPTATWKVVLVMPNGSDDLRRVSRATRAFGVVVSNVPPINRNGVWRDYRMTVDEVEALTGYNFFSAVPAQTQEYIERRRDTL